MGLDTRSGNAPAASRQKSTYRSAMRPNSRRISAAVFCCSGERSNVLASSSMASMFLDLLPRTMAEFCQPLPTRMLDLARSASTRRDGQCTFGTIVNAIVDAISGLLSPSDEGPDSSVDLMTSETAFVTAHVAQARSRPPLGPQRTLQKYPTHLAGGLPSAKARGAKPVLEISQIPASAQRTCCVR